MGVNGYQILGFLSLAFSGLIMYWLSSPTPALNADPLNSVVLIIFAIVFSGAGLFLTIFSYLFTEPEE